MKTWRCVISGIGAPSDNMATDEALFKSACMSGVPVLRLYGWSPGTVSLGFAQRACEALDLAEITRRNLAWVRRPTGGRAVLHDMEVTYSLSVPASDPLYELGLAASYEWICGPIIGALGRVGVPAMLSPHYSVGFVSASCFAAPGTTDILASHRKIVGSAQMRTRDGFLQHGSIVLKNDLEKLFAVVRTADCSSVDAAHRAARLMTSVSDEAHRTVSFQEMVDALVADFSALESVKLVPDVLSPEEIRESAVICTQKYDSEGWNALR
jgi:lipoyl(octanoyl) transferase